MKTQLKTLVGLVLLIFLTTSLTLVALAETSDEDETLFSYEKVDLTPGSIETFATVITVSTTADDLTPNANCTLREAIKAANDDAPVDACPAGSGSDTIVLSNATYILIMGDLRITRTMTITGTGAGSTIIDGNNRSRIFRILSTGVATVSEVTLTNGNGTGGSNGGGQKGGAIWIFHGDLTLLNSTVTSNTTGNNDGGGIVNEGGTLIIENSTISNNTGHGGGGVSNRDGTATINNTTISGNTASSGGFVDPGIGVGGGVSNAAVTDNSTLTINQSTITANKATGTGGGGVNNNASNNHTANTTLNQTIVSGNDAAPLNVFLSSSTGFGGGIRNGFAEPVSDTTTSILVVNNSAISGNKAVNAGGIGNGTTSTTSTLTLKTTLNNTTVSGNTTPNQNGGSLQGDGGGLVNANGTLSLVNSTVSGNAANGTHATGGLGGGIFNGGLDKLTTLWLTNTTISSNTVANEGEGVANYKAVGVAPVVNFKNSIIAGGCANGLTGLPATAGTLTSHGNNLDDSNNNNCNLMTATGDLTNTNPLLGSLQSNGGLAAGVTGATTPMLTHALLENSPALGAGDQTTCAAAPINNLDQRGVTRPAGDTNCDIGAFESSFKAPITGLNTYLPIVIKS